MRGKPWEFIHGRSDRRIHVAIDKQGNGVQVDDGDEVEQERPITMDEDDNDMQFRGGTDKLHVSRKAIEKYGPTTGCRSMYCCSRRRCRCRLFGLRFI